MISILAMLLVIAIISYVITEAIVSVIYRDDKIHYLRKENAELKTYIKDLESIIGVN